MLWRHTGRSGAIGEQQRPVAANATRRYRTIALEQAIHHPCFLAPGYDPQNAPGPVENRVSQSHPAPPLISPAQRDIRIFHVQCRITGHKRSRMAIRTETEMYQVEHWRRSGNLLDD